VADSKHDTANHDEHGTGRYWKVYLLLLLFTAITVGTGKYVHLGGSGNIVLAMVIATVKASLVVLFFMHLYDDGGVNRLVFVVSVLFVLVLIGFVFGDLMTRLPITLPYGGPRPHSGHIELPADH
jgi:cytochrome c oxidase subunit 4